MPTPLDPGDRRLLIAAGILLLVVLAIGAVLSPAQNGRSSGIPSSYSPDWDGAKAGFLLLQELGYSTERWERPPEELPQDPRRTVLVLAEPFFSGGETDSRAIRRFIGAGGRVLATGAPGARLVPGGRAEPEMILDYEPKRCTALLPSPLTNGAPEISMVAPAIWKSNEGSQLAVYGEENRPVVVTYSFGKGRVIWWAAPTPLSNGGIREADNLALLLNSLGPPGATRVLWDEYFHGQRGSLGAYLGRTPLPWAGVQIGILLIAILFTFSRRWGPVRAPAVESRLSPLEFVETLGDLYHSAHASPAAVGVSYQQFRFLLLRGLALPAKTKLPELCRRAHERLGWSDSDLLDTLSRSERAMRSIQLQEKEALELVQQLHDYTARLEQNRRGA